VGYIEQALQVLPHLPETRATREQAIDCRLALRSALFPSRDSGRILAYLREAETLAAVLDDPRRLAQASYFLSVHFNLMGAHDQAITAAQRALALATASGEVVLQALANNYLGRSYHNQGYYRQAIACFGQTVAGFDGARRRERCGQVFLPAVSSRAYLAVCHAELGTFVEGQALGEEGLRIAEAVDDPGSRMFALWGIGTLGLRQGDLRRALPRLERALGICQDVDLPAMFPIQATTLGAAYTLAGRIADAVLLLTQALEQTATTEEAVAFQALCCLPLGEAHLRAGRLEEAHACAQEAYAAACGHQERGHEVYALRLLGEIAAHRVPPQLEQAEAHYRQAIALSDALGMRPLHAHCHHGLGMLYAQSGEWEQARTPLATAIALYRAMDMAFWLSPAEAALGQVEGQ
jgi:tetratricopeptide (TPR) repeat protein